MNVSKLYEKLHILVKTDPCTRRKKKNYVVSGCPSSFTARTYQEMLHIFFLFSKWPFVILQNNELPTVNVHHRFSSTLMTKDLVYFSTFSWQRRLQRFASVSNEWPEIFVSFDMPAWKLSSARCTWQISAEEGSLPVLYNMLCCEFYL